MPSTKTRANFSLTGAYPTPDGKCPICRSENAGIFVDREFGTMTYKGWCPTCSNYWISEGVIATAKSVDLIQSLIVYLRGLPPKWWDDHNRPIMVDEVDTLIKPLDGKSTIYKLDRLLLLICEANNLDNGISSFDYVTDWPLVPCVSPGEALWLIRQLSSQELLESDSTSGPIPPRPTWKAYQRLQELQAQGINSAVGFVAMSFSNTRTAAWNNIIKPAISAAGYQPFRIDRHEHVNRIDDEIIAQIKRSRFVVADFTEQKAGVYFEAGLALGLGRNVIWMCEEQELAQLHFDTRQFNHIIYKDHEESEIARKALELRIVSLEGQGSYALKA